MRQLLLLLLCVGACLSAAAITPQTKNAQVISGKPVRPVKSLPNLGTQPKHHLSSFTAADLDGLSVPRFFQGMGLTPNNNRLMKKAPRRVTPNDIASDKLVFYEAFSYDFETGDVEPEDIFNYGGWEGYIQEVEDGVFDVYDLYYNLPLTMYVDYDSNTAELAMDYLAGFQWADTIVSGSTTTISDTTMYVFAFDEDYLMGYSDDPSNITGQVYEDGSIYFEGGYMYYMLECTSKTITRFGRTTVTNDTIESMTPILRNTYLITPNAVHTYLDTYDNSEGGNYAYMYQYDDSTAIVWNLYSLGYPGNFMYIHNDGSLKFPALQYGGDMASEREYLEELYPDYDWSEGDHVIFMGYNEELGYPDYEMDNIEGTVTPTQLNWGPTSWTWWGMEISSGSWGYVYINPFINNQLTFINGETWDLDWEEADNPEIYYTITDEYAIVEAVGNGTIKLYTFDEDFNAIQVENPYFIPRTDEDQIHYFAAIAFIDGMAPSETVYLEVAVPAKVPIVIGDVNGDNVIDLVDITTLIEHLLKENFDDPNFIIDAADVNQDATLDLNDLVELINKILNAK